AVWKLVAQAAATDAIAAECRSGALGCVADKSALADALNAFLAPIRQRRALYAQDPGAVERVLLEGTERVRELAAQTLRDVKAAMRFR
ncbi:MAG: hypothetical protein ACYDHD_12405, partial [Vulcanimicrobiaceae bacterium]